MSIGGGGGVLGTITMEALVSVVVRGGVVLVPSGMVGEVMVVGVGTALVLVVVIVVYPHAKICKGSHEDQ